MKGYYKDPEQTADDDRRRLAAHRRHRLPGREGYLHITDRSKDMIITGGFNVYPSEVEQVIWSHPAVQDCSVIGVPDDEWGEAVKAVVELNPGADGRARRADRAVQGASSAASRRRRPSTSSTRCRAAPSARSSRPSCASATGRPRRGAI